MHRSQERARRWSLCTRCFGTGTNGGPLSIRQWNIGFPKRQEIWVAERLLASQCGFCFLQFSILYSCQSLEACCMAVTYTDVTLGDVGLLTCKLHGSSLCPAQLLQILVINPLKPMVTIRTTYFNNHRHCILYSRVSYDSHCKQLLSP
jgi:hypothetical protein